MGHEAGAGRPNTMRGVDVASIGAGSRGVTGKHEGGSADAAVGPGEGPRDHQVREGGQGRVT